MQGHILLLTPQSPWQQYHGQHYLCRGTNPIFIVFNPPRSPALIGCFVVDRLYFEEIGLLDEGMEVYGGENVELGIRVSRGERPLVWPLATFQPDNGLKMTVILMALNVCGGHSHTVSAKYLKDQVSLAAELMALILGTLGTTETKKKKICHNFRLKCKKKKKFFWMTLRHKYILLDYHYNFQFTLLILMRNKRAAGARNADD